VAGMAVTHRLAMTILVAALMQDTQADTCSSAILQEWYTKCKVTTFQAEIVSDRATVKTRWCETGDCKTAYDNYLAGCSSDAGQKTAVEGFQMLMPGLCPASAKCTAALPASVPAGCTISSPVKGAELCSAGCRQAACKAAAACKDTELVTTMSWPQQELPALRKCCGAAVSAAWKVSPALVLVGPAMLLARQW